MNQWLQTYLRFHYHCRWRACLSRKCRLLGIYANIISRFQPSFKEGTGEPSRVLHPGPPSASVRDHGFSDGLFDCLTDLPSCALSFLSPLSVILVWQIYDRTQPPPSILPLGAARYMEVVAIYGICVWISIIIPVVGLVSFGLCAYVVYCTYFIVADLHGVRQRADQGMVFLQAVCCHQCLLGQLTRQVNRETGFIPRLEWTPTARVVLPPRAPILECV